MSRLIKGPVVVETSSVAGEVNIFTQDLCGTFWSTVRRPSVMQCSRPEGEFSSQKSVFDHRIEVGGVQI